MAPTAPEILHKDDLPCYDIEPVGRARLCFHDYDQPGRRVYCTVDVMALAEMYHLAQERVPQDGSAEQLAALTQAYRDIFNGLEPDDGQEMPRQPNAILWATMAAVFRATQDVKKKLGIPDAPPEPPPNSEPKSSTANSP